ncbi:MAG: flagellar assembly peptidoglycan hydrolase FlgJ [Pseudomonadota bacterium]
MQSNLYSDFGELASLRLSARQADSVAASAAARDANHREVAGQFEALFVQMMVKAMRDAVPKGDLFNSSSMESYQSMYDQQLALDLARQGGIGLADVIVSQFDASPASARRSVDEWNPLPARTASLTGTSGPISPAELTSVRSAVPVESTAAGSVSEGAASSLVHGSQAIVDPESFLEVLAPLASDAAQQLGTQPDVLLAQAALETGWGKSVISSRGVSSNNLFNIKAGSDWSGPTVTRSTLEFEDGMPVRETAQFRAYESAADSFRDYVDLIGKSPRYSSARDAGHDPVQYMHELQAAGYATDPSYADKVLRIRDRILAGEGL